MPKMYILHIKKIILLTIIVHLCVIEVLSQAGNATYECNESITTVDANQGFLSIRRSSSSCGFEALNTSQLFIIVTDDLYLFGNDKIQIEADKDAKEDIRLIEGPQDAGYIVLGLKQPKITFKFDDTVKQNSVMRLKFYQDMNVPLLGDKKRDIVIRSFGMKPDLKFDIKKSVPDPIYIEEVGNTNFGHRLIEKSDEVYAVNLKNDMNLTMRISPALKECSKTYESKNAQSFEVDGPNGTVVKDLLKYKCVNIFKSTNGEHFDVDFKNFIEMVDSADELYISDGIQSLSVTESSYRYYKELIPNISFKGQNLVVVYDSPQKLNRLSIQFKLSIHSRSSGGIVDTFNYKLEVPAEGSAYYSLKTPSTGQSNVALVFDKLVGTVMTVYNRQNKVIVLNNTFPSTVPFSKPDDSISIEFKSDSKKKVTGSVIYKPGTDCSGTLFEPSGTISITGRNKTCYWFLGAQANVIGINLNDLQTNGYFEIYSLQAKKTILESKNRSPTESLPPIVINGQALLKVQLSDKYDSSFYASISPPTKSFVTQSTDFQSTITSLGYPTYYWSDKPEETNTFGFLNKQVILSVVDVDLREGEKMKIENYTATNVSLPTDLSFDNQTIKIIVQRSVSQDLKPRRGYKLVTTEYQKKIVADIKKNVVTTPKNLSSLYLRIPGNPGKRLTYNISFSKPEKNYYIQVVDSRSILGRQMNSLEKFNGSTTSNELLISLRAQDKTFLPELVVNYAEIPCNKTIDHICDGNTRCVPAEKMCKGLSYCTDGSDLKVPCSNGPAPPPKVIENGVSGVTVFILSILMFTIGAITALYGPDLYKNFESRYRSGQYTTFQSAE